MKDYNLRQDYNSIREILSGLGTSLEPRGWTVGWEVWGGVWEFGHEQHELTNRHILSNGWRFLAVTSVADFRMTSSLLLDNAPLPLVTPAVAEVRC